MDCTTSSFAQTALTFQCHLRLQSKVCIGLGVRGGRWDIDKSSRLDITLPSNTCILQAHLRPVSQWENSPLLLAENEWPGQGSNLLSWWWRYCNEPHNCISSSRLCILLFLFPSKPFAGWVSTWLCFLPDSFHVMVGSCLSSLSTSLCLCMVYRTVYCSRAVPGLQRHSPPIPLNFRFNRFNLIS